MLRLAVFALLVAAASAKAPVLGKVEGISDCGSQGNVLEVRVTDCTTLPCDFLVGQTYQIEVDFEPSVEHSELLAVATIFSGGVNVDIFKEFIPAAVSPGNAYTLAYPWTVHGDHGFGNIALRINLSGSGVTELCGIATANVIETQRITRKLL
ncbi:unnamed protein product [Allacma fusca]|uniref:MD-2-related lipid-recognition domain-containing protein n=1 Tax=Allacma fusca TaxID=39272 RepID=A0A8J2J6E4_9HEXA|nr:unnamed protein product [Allacma fusca]